MRLPQIDFLRGCAVILVLFRHHWVGVDLLQKMGWVGVDLFFVLSGFLVSGLLFVEYKKFGNARPGYFLLRRAFKIYPLFYVSLALTALVSVFLAIPELDGLNAKGQAVVWASEVFFLQNYVAFLWGHHWSLAVEEHFYLLVAALALFRPTDKRIVALAGCILLGCLAIRVAGLAGPGETHGRADSLFAGVVIAYVYHFHDLKKIYEKFKYALLALGAMPFLVAATVGFYDAGMRVGFTLIYIGFGSLLIVFLYGWRAENLFTRAVGVVGVYSYGIYLFHLYLIKFVVGDAYLYEKQYAFDWGVLQSFAIYFIGSIALGMAMSYLVEKPFLAVRDRYFPRRREHRQEVLQGS